MAALEPRFTVRVRLILLCADHVLTALHIPTNLRFLPGGGLEHGESAIACLRRELAEESDLQLLGEIRPFGIVENRFEWRGADIHEMLIHFIAALDDGVPPPVTAREPQLRFDWVAIDGIEDTEIWPPETYSAVRAARSGHAQFHYAPLQEANS